MFRAGKILHLNINSSFNSRCLLLAVLLLAGQACYSQLTFTVNGPIYGYTLNCFYSTVPLTASSNYSAAVSYTWQSPTQASSTGNTYTATSPGIYTVSASAGSLSASQTVAISINTLAPTLSVTATGTAISCATGSVMLQAYSTSTNLTYGWYWPNSIILPVIQTDQYLALAPVTYTCIIRDNNNACTTKTTITIADNRNYPIINSAGPFTVSCPGGTVDIGLVVSGNSANYTYQWYTPAGAIAGATTAALPGSSPNFYKVVVTDVQNGCMAQSFMEVWACTGIDEGTQDDIAISIGPNPVKDRLTVRRSTAPYTLAVYSALGQPVFMLHSKELLNEIDLEFLQAGIYSLVVQYPEGKKVLKILKE